MISPDYVRLMARYNQWQNGSLYTAADQLTQVERLLDRGAFFGSIQRTLSHLLWGDQQWMSRFAGTPKPVASGEQSPDLYADWEELKRLRQEFDLIIIAFADGLDGEALQGNLRWYSGLQKAEVSKPLWGLITHFFNHQTHHRGQVHAMLTAAGARPDDTDLMLMKGFGEVGGRGVMEKAKTALRSSMCAHRFLEIIYDEMLGRLAASTFIARDKTELAE